MDRTVNHAVSSSFFSPFPSPAAVTRLLEWYDASHRALPWREEEPRDSFPYRVWISEIMLQQTRVEAVKEYYTRFLRALPTTEALAGVSEQRLMKLWEGLGYYSRARNLKKAAETVCALYGGALPASYDALRALPGIGSYTAGAIASIAFAIPSPAVDGNVLRVLARFAACPHELDLQSATVRKDAEETVRQMIPAGRPGDFTQSMIELGATVCLPNAEPKCSLCPFREECLGYAGGDPKKYPLRKPKKERRIENRTVLLLRDRSGEKERFMLRQRPSKGLLAGLYEFPGFPGSLDEREALAAARGLGFDPDRVRLLPPAVHIFTHVEWRMTVYEMTGGFPSLPVGERLFLAEKEEIGSRYAIPSAFAACLARIFEGDSKRSGGLSR